MQIHSKEKSDSPPFLSDHARNILAALLIVVIVTPVYMLSSNNEVGGGLWSGDTKWTIYTDMSIIKHGKTNIDEYITSSAKDYRTEYINGHAYNFFPIGTSLLSLPAVFVIDRVSANFNQDIRLSAPLAAEKTIATIITVYVSVLLFFIAQLFLKTRYSFLLALTFALCTSAWSIASRALWQHGPSMLMLTIALYLILLARKRPAVIQYAALPLAFSWIIRPTNSISCLLLSIYVLVAYRKYFLRYLMWSLVFIVPFIIYSYYIYGAPYPTYYEASRLGSEVSVTVTALLGNLISPSRGLLLFSPVLLFAAGGFYLKARKKQLDTLDYFIVAIIFLHWIAISTFGQWWGGWTYGPRLFSDMIPYFVYLMIPVFAELPRMKGSWKIPIATAFCVLAAFSFFVQFRGATDESAMHWNDNPVNVDNMPSRLWDWGDPQFVRGL